MSIRREQVLIRVRTALVDLEALAEGKAMTWDGEKISHGKPGSQILGGANSELDSMVESLEEWCTKAEKCVVRGRPKPETTPEELRFRILNDYVGRDSERVAEDEGCTRKHVEDLRLAHGLTQQYGKPARRRPKVA